MPIDRIFSSGGQGKGYVEIAEWYGRCALNVSAQHAFVPFSGFGRMASAISQENVLIDTCDYLRVSAAVVEGIFTATSVKSNVDKPRFHRGAAVAGKLISGGSPPDVHSAGFIDWVVTNGTSLDLACVGMAIPSQTMRGWLTKWTGDFDHLWAKFTQIRDECVHFLSMPGEWIHFEADLFKLQESGQLSQYDFLAIDPPRLCPTQDLYSRGWRKFNETLGGTARIHPWTDKNYFKLLDRVLSIDCRYIAFTWTEGSPSTQSIKAFLQGYGTILEEEYWHVYTKDIYGWLLERTQGIHA